MHRKLKRLISLVIAVMLVLQNIAPTVYASDPSSSETGVITFTSEPEVDTPEQTPVESTEAKEQASVPAQAETSSQPVESTESEAPSQSESEATAQDPAGTPDQSTASEETKEPGQATDSDATDASEEATAPGEAKEPEATTASEKAEDPEETTAPKETEDPEETTAPEETEDPVETEDPEETEESEETEDPEETEESEETEEPEETEETEPALPEGVLCGPLLSFADVGLAVDSRNNIVYLEDAQDLLLLSLLPGSLYQSYTLSFGSGFAASTTGDLSRQYVDVLEDGVLTRRFFCGLGNSQFPFSGCFVSANSISLVLNCALFQSVSTQFQCSPTLNLTLTSLRDEDVYATEDGQLVQVASPWNSYSSVLASEFRMNSDYTCNLNVVVNGNQRTLNSLIATTSGGSGTLNLLLYASSIGSLNTNSEGTSGLIASTHNAGTICLLSGSTAMENMIGTMSDSAVFMMQDDAQNTDTTDVPTEDAAPTETEESAETEESTPEPEYPEDALFAPLSSFADVLLDVDEGSRTIHIDSANDLVRLSLLPAALYQDYTLSFGECFGDASTADVSREFVEVVEDGVLTRRFFRGLGSEQAPFCGSFESAGTSICMTLNQALFRCVSTQFICSSPLTISLSTVTDEECSVLVDGTVLSVAAAWENGSSVLASDFRMDSDYTCQLNVTVQGNQKTILSVIGTTSGQDGTLKLLLTAEAIGSLLENEEGITGLLAFTHSAGTIYLLDGSSSGENMIGTLSDNARFYSGDGSGSGQPGESDPSDLPEYTDSYLIAPLCSFEDVHLTVDTESQTVFISNAQELLRLSLLPGELYQNYSIVFQPDWFANGANDLSAQYVDVLNEGSLERCFFQGLGSAAHPFSGQFISSMGQIPFILNTALFRGLSGSFQCNSPLYLKLSNAAVSYAPAPIIPDPTTPAECSALESVPTEEYSDSEQVSVSDSTSEQSDLTLESSSTYLSIAAYAMFSDSEDVSEEVSGEELPVNSAWDGGNILSSVLSFQDGDQTSLDLDVDGNGQSAQGVIGSTTGGDGTLNLTLNETGLASLNSTAESPSGIVVDSHEAGTVNLTEGSSVQEDLTITGTEVSAGLLGSLSENAVFSYPETMAVALYSTSPDAPVRNGTTMTVCKPLNELLTFEDVGLDANSYNAATKTIKISSALDLVALSLLPAELYADWTLDFTLNWAGHENAQDLTVSYVDVPDDTTSTGYQRYFFQGLGSSDHPFEGKFLSSDSSQNSGIKIVLNRSLFQHLSSAFDCEINPLILHMGKSSSTLTYDENGIQSNTVWDSNSSILAESLHFVEPSTEDSVLSLQIVGNGQSFSGLIGSTLSSNPSQTEATTLNLKLDISDLGTACAKSAGSSGNAGMLVNDHNAGNLHLESDSQLPSQVNLDGSNAVGILFGALGQNAGFSSDTEVSFRYATLSGKTIGGLIGEASVDDSRLDLSNLSIQEVNVPSSSNANIVGGVVGNLHMTGDAQLSICDSVSIDLNRSVDSLGGLVGQVTSDSLQATLTVSGIAERNPQITTHRDTPVKFYGGLVGSASGSSCIQVKAAAPELYNGEGATITNLGGAIARVSDGCIVDVCPEPGSSFAPSTTQTFGVSTTCGGVVGAIEEGCALRLGGTVDITGFSPTNDSIKYGKIVGTQTNALIFTDDENFTIPGADDKAIDDIGNYGSIIRNYAICSNHGSSCPGVISYTDLSDGTRSLKILGTLSDTITNECDFARLAIYCQTQGVFRPDDSTYTEYPECMKNTFSIPANTAIDMTPTGIYGIQKDNNALEAFEGRFICGEGSSLNLDFGTIYRHNRIGLFGYTKNATFQNLNLFSKGTAMCGIDTYCGGVVANADGWITFEDVTVSHEVTVGAGSISLGALIGRSGCNTISIHNTPSSSGNADIWVRYSGGNNRIGGLIGAALGNNKTITITGTTVGSTTLGGNSSITSSGAHIGGLISHVDGSSNTLTLSNVTIDGMDLSRANGICGGFIGYTLADTTLVTNSVTAQNGSIIGQRFGGLVYDASGYWNLVSDEASVIMDYLDLTSNGDLSSSPSALMVGIGTELYLELNPEKFTRRDIRVNIANSSSFYFDELVGKTREKDSGSGKQGIVSIVSNPLPINQASQKNTYGSTGVVYSGNSGTSVKFDDLVNPYTRYYYDLDVYRDNPTTAGQKMLLWSVYQIAADKIRSRYFGSYSSALLDGETIDLTGLSYYPVDHNGSIRLNGATVIFDYKTIQETEKSSGSKRTLDASGQHSMMQCGLFRNAGSFSIEGLILRGSVGKTFDSEHTNGTAVTVEWYAGSGALVCGVLSGGNSSLKNIKMDDLYVADFDPANDYAPLLINRIGSDETLTLTGLQAVTTQNAVYCNGDKVASSLIGNVGDEQAHDIHLNFGSIHLDGRSEAGTAAYPYGNTTSAIFTRATLLQKFQYTASCSGGYYFNQDEDSNTSGGWTDTVNAVTYGFEITETVENAIETEDANGDASFESMQREYFEYDDKQYVTKNGPSATEPSNTEFRSGYLPYVAVSPANTPSESLPTGCHELDVNLKKGDLIEGCGTYEDPYIIDSPLQLTTLAYFLSNHKTEQGWQVNVKTTSALCDKVSGHATYVSQSGASWRLKEGSGTITDDAMAEYLSGAYYLIDRNIKCNNFPGLGSAAYPFSGVIYGISSDVTVTTGSESAMAGGLIAYSNGSVVKNLTIISTIKAELNEVIGAFAGGVIGTVLGGETIIDNVTVQLTATLSGTYERLICTGGYVGLLQNGGVIFRNVSTDKCTTTERSADYLYSNRCIGRVLDGYAYCDGCSLENSLGIDPKYCNYTIHSIASAGGSVVSGDTIIVTSAEELWALSAYVNSSEGFGGRYKAHSALYDPAFMGKGAGSSGADYSQARTYNDLGDPSSLEEKYGLSGAFAATKINVVGDLDLTAGYYNGFRGIGTKYAYSNGISSVLLNVSAINQEPSKVTLGMQILEYDTDPYRGVGAGLITSLKNTTGTTVKNLTVSGYVVQDKHYSASSGAESESSNEMREGYYAGGIIGRCDSKLILDNCRYNDIHVTANRYAGGLVGYCGGELTVTWSGSMQKASISARELDGTYELTKSNSFYKTRTAGSYAGSIAGFCDGVLKIGDLSKETGTVSFVEVIHDGLSDALHAYRLGGLVGASNGEADVQNVCVSGLKIFGFPDPRSTSISPQFADEASSGGIIGIVFGSATLQSVQVSAAADQNNVIFGKVAGGFVGRTDGAATLTDCHISGNSKSNPLFIYGLQRCSAGVTFVNKGALTVTDCSFGGSGDNPENLQLYTPKFGSHAGATIGCVYAKINSSQTCCFTNITSQNLLVMNGGEYGGSFCLGGVSSGGTCIVENITISNCTGIVKKTSSSSFARNSSCFGALAASVEENNTSFYASNIYLNNLNMGCIVGNQVSISESGMTYSEDRITYSGSDANHIAALIGRITIGISRVQIIGVTYQGNRPTSDIALYGVYGDTAVPKDTPIRGSNQLDVPVNLTNDSFIVYSDYTGKSSVGSEVTLLPSGAVIPLSDGGSLTLASDGACFAEDGSEVGILGEIYQGIASGDSNYYWNYLQQVYTQDGITTLDSHKDQASNTYVQNFPDYWSNSSTSPLEVTTYKTLQASSDEDDLFPDDFVDFPVLRVTNGFDVLLALEMLTNCGFQIARDCNQITEQDLTITTYQMDESGTFQIYKGSNDDPMPTLEYHFSKTDGNHDLFTIPAGRSDKGSNKLTLVTVQFRNKRGELKYTLYLPIVVDKPIYINITAMAANGSEFRYEGGYFVSSSEKRFTASYGDTVSFLLNYQYTYDDWGALPDDWHFEKVLHTNGSMPTATIPAGTRLTLVDLNGESIRYYFSTTSEEVNTLDLCQIFTDWDPTPTAKLPSNPGTLVKEESYILILDLPEILGSNSAISSMHEGPLDCGQNVEGGHEQINQYANVVHEEHTNFFILPSFEHDMTIHSSEASNYPTMKDSASSEKPAQVILDLSDTIRYFPGLRGQTSYLDFVLMTQRVTEGSSISQPFTADIDAGVTIWFVDQNGDVISGTERSYPISIRQDQPNITLPYGAEGSYEDIQDLLLASDGEITVKARITLSYDEYSKHANFPDAVPPNEGELPEAYVKFNASCRVHSNASSMNAGSHGNATDTDEVYYCGIEKDMNLPQLNYYLVEQPIFQFNHAGINVLSDDDTSPVSSQATYITSGIEDPLAAIGLKCTLTIYRKTDSGTYEPVPGSPSILWDTPEIEGHPFLLNAADGSYEYTIPNTSSESPFSGYYYGIGGEYQNPIISFPITLKIKSYTSDTNYANYQAYLKVELINRDGSTYGSASDPAIYTKAKISTTVFAP